MWFRVVIVVSVTTQTWAQYTFANQKVQQGGTQFEWGWQLTPVDAQLPLDHYFVQTGPQIQYADNYGGLQNAGPLVDVAALSYNTGIPYQIYQNPENHSQTIQGVTNQAPLDIFLLHQQYPVQNTQTQQNNIAGDSIQYTNAPHSYNIQHTQNNPTTEQTANPLIRTTTNKENDNPNNAIITPIVQVFKDHNCTNDDIKEIKQSILDEKIYEVDDKFGAKETPLYKAAADFKIETRSNTNNEGYYYYSTEITPTTRNYYEGISKLVASTQDLITNDDLITINHSAEKQVFDIDEYIKPYNLRTEESRNNRNKHQITLKAKIRNIENRAIPNSNTNNKILQNDYENKFASPIVVQDSSYDDYKEQILDTLVSTMTPFIENGYVISSIQKNESKNAYLPHNFNEDTVYVTPRPIGQKYLAPITVALRLLNSNNTDIFNTIEDPDTSDSEFVEEKVKIPSKEKTIVEIQESIPLDITHINEVEVHQYLEDGRSKYPTNEARNLHNSYNDRQFKENHVNYQVSDEYGKKNIEKTNGNSNYGNKVKNNDDGIEKIESSENVESQVTVEFNSFKENKHNKNNNNEDVFGKRNNRKVIQPIIVEKEIPVLQYIDRYIEKQIPNSEPKLNHIPVDRPVVIPVPYEKIVEKPVEVTKYNNKPYPVEVPQPYPVPIKVPYPVEKKVYVDRPVHIPYPIEKIVEKEVVRNVPVPTPVAVPVKVQIPIEKPVIVPIPVERPYPVPVEKPVEKIVEKPVHINVPVPIPIHIIKHYPVDRIVEKKVPYPVKVEPTIDTKYIENPYNVGRTENMPYIIQTYTVDNSKPEESQNHPQYQQNAEQNKAVKSQIYNQLQGNLKDKQQFTYTVPIQTTQWGSLYASTYKYINIKPHQAKNNQIYNKYLTTNQNIYYGPPPLQTYNNYWENYKTEVTNRFERQPKVANLRIEYGFKPPLIPSIEVDLNGRPINKETEK